MDEYDYLEAQVDAGAKANGSGSVPPEDKKERRSSSRDRDRKRSRSKDRRRSRSKDRRSRSRERRRERSRDRRDKDRDRDDRGRDAFRDRDYGRRYVPCCLWALAAWGPGVGHGPDQLASCTLLSQPLCKLPTTGASAPARLPRCGCSGRRRRSLRTWSALSAPLWS